MMDEHAFNQLVREIESQGYDHATADYYASLIGDIPIVDINGNVLVTDWGSGHKTIAILKPLKFFGH